MAVFPWGRIFEKTGENKKSAVCEAQFECLENGKMTFAEAEKMQNSGAGALHCRCIGAGLWSPGFETSLSLSARRNGRDGREAGRRGKA